MCLCVPTASPQRPRLLTISTSCSTEPLAHSRRSWALLPLCFLLMLPLSAKSLPPPHPLSAWLTSPWLFRLGICFLFSVFCPLPSCPIISTHFYCTSVLWLPGVWCLHLTLSSLWWRSSLLLVSQGPGTPETTGKVCSLFPKGKCVLLSPLTSMLRWSFVGSSDMSCCFIMTAS